MQFGVSRFLFAVCALLHLLGKVLKCGIHNGKV
jgi:hypothetical protein